MACTTSYLTKKKEHRHLRYQLDQVKTSIIIHRNKIFKLKLLKITLWLRKISNHIQSRRGLNHLMEKDPSQLMDKITSKDTYPKTIYHRIITSRCILWIRIINNHSRRLDPILAKVPNKEIIISYLIQSVKTDKNLKIL